VVLIREEQYMQEQVKLLAYYLQGIWLQRRYILILAWIICPIGWIGVTLLPNQYTSEAKVYADTQSILGPLLRGLAIQTDPSQRLELMAKTLLNTRNLEVIGNEVDANIRATTPEEYEELLNDLKSGIIIRSAGRNNLYTISYTGENPVFAKNVVQAALNVFIESSLGDKRLDAEQARYVINDQIEYYENRLVEAEKDLADFKREYIGLLPGSDQSYYSNLESEKSDLEQAELALKEARSGVARAKLQLEEEKQNALSQIFTIQTEYDARIEAVEMRLDELLFRYTQKHPDVVETKRQLLELKQLKSQSVKNITVDNSLNDNLVYQDLKISIYRLNNEIASLEVRVEKHKAKIDEYQSKLDIVPDVEAMLTSLTRNYEVTKGKYLELMSRGETASISNSVGNASEDIKFKIIEPPSIPTSPSGPNRLLLLLAVLVAGVGAGFGVSFIMSQMYPVATSPNQLYQMTGVPVFGVVSATACSGLLAAEKKRLMVFIFMTLMLLSVLFMLLVINTVPSIYSMIR
jgi:polysaccharide chain length determinant protein (PEP-CTERM system associated)